MNGQKKELSLSLFFCLSGTALRLIFAFIYKPWEQAPDQLAWEFLLNEGTISYAQLIHYPHEGGTILASIIAKFFALFTDFHPLTLTALLLDFTIRMVMLQVVSRVFHRHIFIAFGVWTIVAGPAIIPWSSVMFGLHSVAAVFPFMLIYLVANASRIRHFYLLSGLLMGIAVWFHYANIILIPAFILYLILSQKLNRKALPALYIFSMILILHLLTRLNADAGFHMNTPELTSIRGTHFFQTEDISRRLLKAWTGPLPGAAVRLSPAAPGTDVLARIWIFLALAGLTGHLLDYIRQKKLELPATTFAMIIIFILIYAVSPFYYDQNEAGNYISYRHLTYILPLVSLFIIAGLRHLKFRAFLTGAFLMVVFFASLSLFTIQPKGEKMDLQTGWVLGVKMGDQQEIVTRAIRASGSDEAQLMEGVGWGVTIALMEDTENLTEKQKHDKIIYLLKILASYPDHYKPFLMAGVETAFSGKYTPYPDPGLFHQIKEEILSRITNASPASH